MRLRPFLRTHCTRHHHNRRRRRLLVHSRYRESTLRRGEREGKRAANVWRLAPLSPRSAQFRWALTKL